MVYWVCRLCAGFSEPANLSGKVDKRIGKRPHYPEFLKFRAGGQIRLANGDLANQTDRDQKELESLNRQIRTLFCEPVLRVANSVSYRWERLRSAQKRAFKVDYLYYILAVLIIGLVAFNVVRFATRSRNPDLLLQYEARKAAARKLVQERSSARKSARQPAQTARNPQPENQPAIAVKSLRQRHEGKLLQRTPWGWPGSQTPSSQQQGIADTVRNFTDLLIREKRVQQNDKSSGSIRALLEDRYGPVDRGMPEIPYEKVKRPLLRDPSEQFDQLDNLGSAESRQLRKKLQFLLAMNVDESDKGKPSETKKSKKVEFRYVDLKDLKQPWGW